MKSLRTYYEEVLRDTNLKYYSSQNWGLPLENVLGDNNAKGFIESIIGASNKDADKIIEMLRSLSPYRCSHIVSTYILGIVLYQNQTAIQNCVNVQLDKLKTNDNDLSRRFLYVWFLICFFHDLGYAYEEGNKRDIEKRRPTIDKRYTKKSMLPAVYTTDLVRNYQKYRLQCMQKYDHGIYGGIKIYEEIKNQTNPRKEIVAVLKVISQIIMVHNIFTCPVDSPVADCYRCHHLEDLLYDKKTPSRLISLSANPLLFLFDLVDSIDPMKGLTIYDLQDIYFDMSNPDCIEVQSSVVEYKSKITGIQSWLTDVSSLRNLYTISL